MADSSGRGAERHSPGVQAAWEVVHVADEDALTELVATASLQTVAAGSTWLLRTEAHASDIGDPPQDFAIVREYADWPDRSPAVDSGPWEERVCHLQREWYRVLASVETDSRLGNYWAIIRVNFNGSPADELAFNTWYSTKHMPEVCANPGFHRAWRLERAEQSGPGARGDFKYWTVYEIDTPDNFADVRRRNTNPWDGLWQSNVAGFHGSSHRLIR